jgi:hypothetical protein
MTATNPMGVAIWHRSRNSGVSVSRLRQRSHPPSSTMPSISMAHPTMIRKAKKGIATGGR